MEVPLKKKNYAQKYRKEWESLSEFQTWLKHLPGNQTIKFTPAETVSNSNSRKAEAMLALYIAEHSSVSCIDHLSDLVKSVFPDSKATDDLKIHRTKCTEIIKNVLAPHFVEELLKDIGQQKYSLITSKQLGIVISQSGPRNFQSPLRWNQYQGHPGRGHRRGQYPRRQQFRPLNQDKAAAPASRGRARYP
ncbi:hypothetical protein ACJJTC_007163 [Scirpophaga incertulas]